MYQSTPGLTCMYALIKRRYTVLEIGIKKSSYCASQVYMYHMSALQITK